MVMQMQSPMQQPMQAQPMMSQQPMQPGIPGVTGQQQPKKFQIKTWMIVVAIIVFVGILAGVWFLLP
ncbi:MAG: hypothetical protein KKF56_02665 [Nanoarchaeota archaeon]|nr:hypothetical protein [Nanoarchaeota archaeon]